MKFSLGRQTLIECREVMASLIDKCVKSGQRGNNFTLHIVTVINGDYIK